MTRFTENSAPAKKLYQLFDRFNTDLTQGADPSNLAPDYIKQTVYSKEPVFKEVELKLFYLGYRRFAAKWNLNKTVSRQRSARAPAQKRQRGT